MGKAAKWLRLLLTGRKEKEVKCGPSPMPTETRSGPISMAPPKERRRWSFRRSVTGTAMEQKSAHVQAHLRGYSDSDMDRKRRDVAMVVATAPAADAAVAAAEEAAVIKIQSVFRSYLARKALCALKGLVKLQALIRGHLVRRQANATLRSVQAMVIAQSRARTQRIRMLEEAHAMPYQRHNVYRRSPQEARSRQAYEMKENIKIVEVDLGESRGSSNSRNSYSFVQAERRDHRLATYSGSSTPYRRDLPEASPARSALTDRSPRARSGHLGEYYFATSESSPPCLSTSSIRNTTKSSLTLSQDYSLFPSYMANTESSRAKARSHSAPKQRPDSYERPPPSRRRPSIEGRSTSRGVRMQQSVKLDSSSASLQESDCGSTSTVLTNTKYARSLMAYEVHSELSLNTNS